MKKYILGRIIRATISIFAVVSIAIVLIYTMIPKTQVFNNDTNITKLKGDNKITYQYQKWEEIGYLDYIPQKEMCKFSDNYNQCMEVNSEEIETVASDFEANGYKIETLESGQIFAYHEYNAFELIWKFFTTFIKVDNPNVVQDELNPNMDRGYQFTTDYNGIPAIKCVGCEYEYQLYFDTSFPFIHQNAVRLNFGYSYPQFSGIETMKVITDGQGALDRKPTHYETGITKDGSENLHTCRYKSTNSLDKLDKEKFNTNYANCTNNTTAPSMVTTSYLFGILALILAYAIAIPAGISMARHKDKWQDKLGIVYINFMIAVPSLAFIYFFQFFGRSAGLPDKFPTFGFGDVRSYIMPIIVLALLSTASTMIWTRRYMVDQSNSDYVKFARAKGLNQKEIFNRHILKNAIIPIVNGIPASVVLCISGSVITETVFAIPGMGKMLPDSINAVNNSMIITLTFIFTALSVFSLLAGDLLLMVVDPRIQLSSKGETR